MTHIAIVLINRIETLKNKALKKKLVTITLDITNKALVSQQQNVF